MSAIISGSIQAASAPTASVAPAAAAPAAPLKAAKSSYSVDTKELMIRIGKYLIEGAAVAFSMMVVLRFKPSYDELLTVAFIAIATFSVLDMFAPAVGTATRQGLGIGYGLQMANVIPAFAQASDPSSR